MDANSPFSERTPQEGGEIPLDPLLEPLGKERNPLDQAWDGYYARWELWCGFVPSPSVRGFRKLASGIGMRLRRETQPAGAICIIPGTPSRILSVVAGPPDWTTLALQSFDAAVERSDTWIRSGGRGRAPPSPAPAAMRKPRIVELNVEQRNGHDQIVSLLLARGASVRSLALCSGKTISILFQLYADGMDRIVEGRR
ncbi:MAG: hypothetical protein JNL80_06525 [Phycisphaerae bacterium]|jgi:hypothetical protein|nr:hypothetical protein [Phycisphaerae bacterium]